MKIYLDVCCYNRPFDEFSNDRIRLEAEAVSIILVSSEVVNYEISQIPNKDKQDAVNRLSKIAKNTAKLNEQVIKRAKSIEKSKIKPYDALHLAFAEYSKIDIFLTTDDKLLKTANKLNFNFNVLNPLDFIYKEL